VGLCRSRITHGFGAHFRKHVGYFSYFLILSGSLHYFFVNNMASTKRMDDCVKEYLLHRGLYASAKAVENESKTEKDKAFGVFIVVA